MEGEKPPFKIIVETSPAIDAQIEKLREIKILKTDITSPLNLYFIEQAFPDIQAIPTQGGLNTDQLFQQFVDGAIQEYAHAAICARLRREDLLFENDALPQEFLTARDTLVQQRTGFLIQSMKHSLDGFTSPQGKQVPPEDLDPTLKETLKTYIAGVVFKEDQPSVRRH